MVSFNRFLTLWNCWVWFFIISILLVCSNYQKKKNGIISPSSVSGVNLTCLETLHFFFAFNFSFINFNFIVCVFLLVRMISLRELMIRKHICSPLITTIVFSSHHHQLPFVFWWQNNHPTNTNTNNYNTAAFCIEIYIVIVISLNRTHTPTPFLKNTSAAERTHWLCEQVLK